MDKLNEGRRVFDIEIKALKKTRDALDDTFLKILDLITNCKGKVIITGMGKPGHIATKLAATFASLLPASRGGNAWRSWYDFRAGYCYSSKLQWRK